MRLNLLPHDIQQSQQRRKLIIRIATVQVAIFLHVGILMLVLSAWESRVLHRGQELSGVLQDFDPAWERTAADASAARIYASQMAEFFQFHGTYPLDPAWLTAIIATVPAHVALAHMEYFDAQITLTAHTADIALAEIHRRRIIATDVFYSVGLGRVVGLDDGLYSYELRVQVW